MSVVDSSGWIEFLRGTDDGRRFLEVIVADEVVVPTIVIVEVRRWWFSSSERVGTIQDLDEVTSMMSRGAVVSLDRSLAELASNLGIRHRLPLADSIVYATAQSLHHELWTQDRDFEGLQGVHYLPKTTG